MTETKIKVPFPSRQDRVSDIVGILREQGSSSSTSAKKKGEQAKPIVLILHGVLAHKDQLYHRQLAQSLSVDSFRFDFRANDESPGEWGMGDFEKDLQDLHVIIKQLREEYNYHVEALVGHSRGALVGWYYFSDLEKRRKGIVQNKENYILDAIPYWAALAGRWRMHRIHDRDDVYEPAFTEKGYFSWHVKVRGQKVTVQVTRKDVDKFANFPIGDKVADFPSGMDCLLIQGTSDKTVPPADVGFYINKLHQQQRRPKSAQLHLVDDADHNFKGHYSQVVDILNTWLAERKSNGDADAAKDLDRRLGRSSQHAKARL